MQERIFEASNGVKVRRYWDAPGIWWEGSDPDEEETALREFFQAERDEELGRWRWPENPDYVVYRRDPVCISVIDEKDGCEWVYYRGGLNFTCPDLIAEAGEAYFAAHPDPKPWHEAEAGEVWVLTVDGIQDPWGVRSGPDAGRFIYAAGESYMPIDHPSITAGRRIWPEPEQESADVDH